jgi:hypothetical protein
MAQSIHVNKIQSQDICIHRLSQLGPFLGKMPLNLIPFVTAKYHDFSLQ